MPPMKLPTKWLQIRAVGDKVVHEPNDERIYWKICTTKTYLEDSGTDDAPIFACGSMIAMNYPLGIVEYWMSSMWRIRRMGNVSSTDLWFPTLFSSSPLNENNRE